METATVFDQNKATAFGGRMLDMISGAALMMMTSVGHEVGLFETMSSIGAATSREVADAAGLNERYVREWLATMTLGKVIDYSALDARFSLPAEHAVSLTMAGGSMNLGLWAWALSGVGETLGELGECFRSGGGIAYSKFTKFPEVMASVSAAKYDASLISTVLPLVPGLVERMNAGVDVVDIGCGTGHAIRLMAQHFPNSRFTGFDFSEASVKTGQDEASRLGLRNARFELKDVATLSGPPMYDFVTAFDAIHDQAHPRKVLRGIADALRPNGTFLCVDIAASSNLHENLDDPMAPLMYAISTMHCTTVSLALGGEGLGAMWGEQKARELFAEAGFTAVETRQIDADPGNNYYICRK